MKKLENYREELEKCSKCGFCEAFCPVYAVTGREPEVARGRNAQLLGVLKGDLSIQEADGALSTCLLCRACVPSCYTGVKTDEIIRAGREAFISAKRGGLVQELVFSTILPYPSRVYVLLKASFFLKRMGLIWLVKKTGLTVPSLTFANALMGNPPKRFLKPKSSDGPHKKGKSVAYFRSCGFNYLLPDTGLATVKVIESLGYNVVFPENNCCGLPPYANGYTDAAIEMAKTNINVLEKFDVILTECGSCSSQLRKYAELLKDNSEYAKKAKRLSERVIDSNEFIYKTLQTGQPQGTAPTDHIKVTYHDPCHLGRYQGITKEPREIIKSIPGVEFVELPEADWCCGGAGAYSIVNNEISMKILDRKMENVRKTGASVLATSCPACMIQLSYGVKRAGLDVKVVHVNQLLTQTLP